uniref:EXS domain-containing protein n=1 Tax=Macrostomum lignano TaxID=282301 RepID=A0A1I8IUQ0_9PLAT
MIENLLLRLSGLAAIASRSYLTEGHHQVLMSGLALLEVFRRFIWNYFRLENEHLNNCGQFRAVRDINIKPVDVPMDADPGFNGSNCGGGGGAGGGGDGDGRDGNATDAVEVGDEDLEAIVPKRYAPHLYRASMKRREQQQQQQQQQQQHSSSSNSSSSSSSSISSNNRSSNCFAAYAASAAAAAAPAAVAAADDGAGLEKTRNRFQNSSSNRMLRRLVLPICQWLTHFS